MKKKTKSIILIATIALVLVLTPLSIWLVTSYVNSLGNKANVEWYSEKEKEFVITTAEELYGMIKLSEFYDFKGQTVKLGADIIVNEGSAQEWAEKRPSQKWYPISGFAGTFDGQGHTISGIYGKSVDSAMGLFDNTQRDCVIKDFKLVNSYFSGTGEGTGCISAYGGGIFEDIYCDAIVETKTPYAGGIIGQVTAEGEHKIANSWFDGSIKMETEEAVNGGCFIGKITKESCIVTIEHCLNTGSISAEGTSRGVDVGGYVGVLGNNAILHVTDSLNSGKVETEFATRVGSLIGSVSSGARSFVSNVYATSECFGATIGYRGGNVQGAPVVYPTARMIGEGGYQWTTLDFEKYWSIMKDDTPILKAYAKNPMSIAGIEKCYDDSWYNEFSTDFTISTLEEFYGFYILSANDNFEGKNIYLGDDLVVNEGNAKEWGEKAPENVWYPINMFAGTFDGQGHTISGVYVKDQNQKLGLFAETTTAAMIMNLRMTNSYLESTATGMAILGSVVGRGNGIIDTVYSDATLVCSGTGCGGIVGQVYTGMTNLITNCWFDGDITMVTAAGKQCGGILGITRADVEIEHCLNTGTITSTEPAALRFGGILGITAGADFTATIRDCLSAGRITAANSRVGAILSEVGNNTSVVMKDVYATTESLSDGKSYINKAIGHINTENVKLNGSGILLPEKELFGTSAYRWTNLNFEKFWAAKANKTPELLTFTTGNNMSVAGVKKIMDTSWYDLSATTYVLDSVEDLYGFFMVSASTDFKGKTVQLGKNITVNSGNASEWGEKAPANIWYPINTFAGTFDGQGKTISGIYAKNANQKLGLFAETTPDAVVKNFKLTNSYMESTSTGMSILGSVVGRGNGTIDSVYSDAILVTTGTGNGGIVGQVYTAGNNKITNCWFNGSITMIGKGGRQAGGILGIARENAVIEHCLNTGTITTKETSALRIGGLFGVITGNAEKITITDSLSAGHIIAANSRVGSAIAEVAADKKAILKDVYVTTESFSTGSAYVNKTIGHTDKEAKVEGTVVVLTEDVMSGVGGYRWTTLNFKEYWVAKTDKTPELKAFTTGENLNTSGIVQANTNWYNAGKDEYVISTLEELYGLVKLSLNDDFKGKKVKLASDITVNSGNAADWAVTSPADMWVPIGTTEVPFAGTFDGQGHTISGIYLKTIGQNSGLFGTTAAGSRIKDLKLTNSYFEFNGKGNAYVASIAGDNGGTIHTVYSDAIVKSSGNYNGGIVGKLATDGARVVNTWFNGQVDLGINAGLYAGGIVGSTSVEGTVYINNCLNSGTLKAVVKVGNSLKTSGVGGICGYVYQGTLVIDDTLVSGEIDVVGNWQGAFIGRLGHGDEDAKHAVAKIDNSYYSTDNKTSTKAVVSQNGTCEKDPVGMEMAGLKGIGGKFNTALDFDNYWSAVRDEAPQLKSFATGDTLSVWKGEGTAEKPWLISNADELKLLAEVASGNDFKDVYFELTNDITVEGNENWMPIGTSAKLFAGNFNGKNHTISGLKYKGTSSYVGLFGGTAESAVIKNFKLANSTFENTATSGNIHIGSVAGYARGTFANIKVENTVTVKSSAFCNGGIIGSVWGGSATISNCWFDGTLTLTGASGRQSGAIVGRVYAGGKTLILEHCLNSGTVTVEATNPQIGGMIGFVHAIGKLTISDSLSATEIPSTATTCGAIIGQLGATAELNDVYGVQTLVGTNTGTLTGSAKGVVTINGLKGDGAYMGTSLDFEDYWVALKDKTPELKYFNDAEPLPNTLVVFKGYGTKKNPWEISSADDLKKLATYTKSYGFAGKYFKVTKNITVVEGTSVDAVKTNATGNWSPIGSNALPFAGTFDGDGKTISGIYYKGNGTYVGLFGALAEDATIKNMTLKNSYFEFTGANNVNVSIGSIAGQGSGTISKVKSEATVVCGAKRSGGFFGGFLGKTKVSDCWFAGTLSLKTTGIQGGGFAGLAETASDTTFEHCLNSGKLSGSYTGGALMLGGFVGNVYNSTVTIKDSLSVGTITATQTWRGSMIGRLQGNTSTAVGVVNITNSYFDKADGCEARFNGVRNQNGTCKSYPTGLTLDQLTGTNAATNAKNLSFTGDDIHWVTTSKTPILKCFE